MNFKKNFIYNTIYQIFILILPMITVPYISRVLGPEGVGIYSYTSSYAQYFVLLGMIGISLYGNRQIAYTKNDKKKMSAEFWNIYTLQVITSVLALMSYIIIFVCINKEYKILYLVQSIVILATVFDISWFFIGYEDMKSVVIRNSVTKIVGVTTIFLFVKDSDDVIVYSIIMVTITLCGQLIMWKGLNGKIEKVKPCKEFILNHLKPSISLFVSQLAMQVYVLLDRTMLGMMTNNTEVGLYDNSQKTIKLIMALVTSVGTVMLPRMSSLYSEGKMEEFKEMINKAFTFITFFAAPMTFGLIAISKGFSVWFYGTSFEGIDILLKFGSFIIIAISWSNILGIQVMLPMKMEKQFTRSVVVGAIVNLVLNLMLIKNMKSLGTTIASVIAEFAVTSVQFYFLRKIIDIKVIFGRIYKPIIGSIIMFLILSIISNLIPIGIIGTVIQIFIGVIIYLISMITMKSDTLKIIKKELKIGRKLNEKI